MSVLMRSVIEAETDMTRKVRYVPLPSAALAAWTSLPRWAPPEPLGYPGRYQTPGFYKCVAAERQTVRALTPRIQEKLWDMLSQEPLTVMSLYLKLTF